MRRRPTARAFLTGVTVASLGLMAGVLVNLADRAPTDIFTVLVAGVALVALMRTASTRRIAALR